MLFRVAMDIVFSHASLFFSFGVFFVVGTLVAKGWSMWNSVLWFGVRFLLLQFCWSNRDIDFIFYFSTPFLVTLYTAHCRKSDTSWPMIKFADDSEITGQIKNNDDSMYMEEIKKKIKNKIKSNGVRTINCICMFQKRKRCVLISGRPEVTQLRPVCIKGEMVGKLVYIRTWV